MAQTVRVGVIGRLKTQGARIPIHFLQEVLHRLITLQTALILIEGAASTRVDASRRILLLVALVILGVRALLVILKASCCFE